MEEDENGEVAIAPVAEVVPTCYRWISTLRPTPDTSPGNKMFLSFSVPASLLPMPCQPALDAGGDVNMDTQEQAPKPQAPSICDVKGCTAKRKYRLVRDQERGACGMEHLHLLEKKLRTVAA
jgi:Ino eighty subunit 2